MHRIAIDTSVVVAAFRSRQGASNRLLQLVAGGHYIALATPTLFLEYEEVLKRPEQLMTSGLTIEQVDRALTGLASLIEPVIVRFGWRPQLDDADDEMVLEAAINGQAEAIVTFNRRDFIRVAPRFGISRSWLRGTH